MWGNHRDFIWHILDIIFPPRCGGCEQWGVRFCDICLENIILIDGPICKTCGEPIKTFDKLTCKRCKVNQRSFDQLRSTAHYQGSLKKAILKLKCNKDVGLANILANLLIDFYKDLDWHVDLITAVPMDKKKLIIRGYNQADLISRPIALHTKIPFVPSVLVKRYPTRPQVGLSEEDRLKNVADAFSSTPKKILGKNVLIIDDVVTTGATMDACSRALKSAGANKVYGISIARSLRV